MVRLTPKTSKMKQEEENLAAKKLKDAKLSLDDDDDDDNDDEDDSENDNELDDDSLEIDGSDDVETEDDEDDDDDEEEAPQQVKTTPSKQRTAKTPKMAKKPTPEVDDDEESEDDEPKVADTPKKDKKSAVPAKRAAQDDDKSPPKKMKMVVDEQDEFTKAQYVRIAITERENLARGIDRLRLHLVGLNRHTTVEKLKAEFPKSTKIEMKRRHAFVSFSSPADVDEAFERSEDLTINERKVKVTYAQGEKKDAEFDEELLEAQYERSCQIERSRLTYGVDKLELIVKWLPKGTTVAELMEAFPTATDANINQEADEGFVNFGSVKDAKLAFDQSLDKRIKKKKVAVLYSSLNEKEYMISVHQQNAILQPRYAPVAKGRGGRGRGRGRGRGGFQKRKNE